MIYYKTVEEIELIRESSLLVAKVLAEVARIIAPGVSTQTLDNVAETFIRDHGGIPAFKGYNGFPASLCISINEEVVHGIPGKRELKEGEIVSVDCGVLKDGFYGDSAYTFPVGEISSESSRLLRVTKECLYLGIENAIVGMRIGDISFAVQQHAENNGYAVVRDLVGHGIGRSLHEKPDVPNYGKRGSGMQLREGLVIAIEPMINSVKSAVEQMKDGWTIVSKDHLPSAHYEHTIAVKKDKAEILTSFGYIDEVLSKNSFEGTIKN